MAHSHSGGLAMLDTLAAHSPLREVSPGLKVVFTVAVLFAAIAAGHWAAGLFVFFSMVLAMAVLGGLSLRKIAALLRIPLLFLVVGCAVVLVEWRNGGFAVTKASALAAGTLFFQALGAVSCLFFFSTTTPMPQLIEVLRRWHLPDVVIELMYLIYRYLFVLLTVQRQMTISATARLGYRGLRCSVATAGKVSGNLLAASFRRSRAYFDAMEARCYDGRLAFLATVPPLKRRHVLTAAGYFIVLLAVIFLFKEVLPG